jgi:hypothetical protein
VLNADQLPTLWDPEALLAHMALWAGVSGVAVAIVVWVLGICQSAKGWVDLAGRAAEGYRYSRYNLQKITTERQWAAVRLAVCSLFAVGFSYMLATIINALVQTAEVEGANALFSSKVVEHAVVVEQWSPAAIWTVVLGVAGIGLLGAAHIAGLTGLRKLISFLGGVAFVFAWIVAVFGGFDAIVGFVTHTSASPNPAPLSLVWTEVITAALCLALGLLLPQISKASRVAFGGQPRG